MPRNRKPAPKAVEPYNTGDAAPPAAPTGLPYGEHKALVNSERAAPIAPATAAAPAEHPAVAAARAMPAAPIGLTGPSARPDEPITAGLASGPGPGPEALGALGATNGIGGAFPADPAALIRSVYQIAPNPDLADLIHYFQGY